MDSHTFIEQAIDRGYSKGVADLTPLEAAIYLISELEVCCDKDGIDSFVNTHGINNLAVCANAFLAMGAKELAAALQSVINSNANDDSHRDTANNLVTERSGYDYDIIERFVSSSLELENET